MIWDLATGEAYGLAIYADAASVILWTAGRESQLSAGEFAETVTLPPEAFGLVLARFQTTADHPTAADLAASEPRRIALADYAAGNGGQVHTHVEPPPPPPLAARWLRGARSALGAAFGGEPPDDTGPDA